MHAPGGVPLVSGRSDPSRPETLCSTPGGEVGVEIPEPLAPKLQNSTGKGAWLLRTFPRTCEELQARSRGRTPQMPSHRSPSELPRPEMMLKSSGNSTQDPTPPVEFSCAETQARAQSLRLAGSGCREARAPAERVDTGQVPLGDLTCIGGFMVWSPARPEDTQSSQRPA